MVNHPNRSKRCCICKAGFSGFGNNPSPVKKSGACCSHCNATIVIPARLKAAKPERRKQARRVTDPSPELVVKAQALAETIKAEIRQDPELMACTSFDELHEHCDANMLGDLPLNCPCNGDFRLCNMAINIVDEWLSSRSLKEEVPS